MEPLASDDLAHGFTRSSGAREPQHISRRRGMMSDPSRRAVILGGARTPFGKLGGALASQSAVDLGTVAARAAIERAGISTADVENTILGQALQGGSGQNPARQVALRAGIGIEIPAETINRVCGSG